jgi:hypothetical protein
VLFTVIYPYYNAFAESSGNAEIQSEGKNNGENNDENAVPKDSNDNNQNNGPDTKCKNGEDNNGNCKTDNSNTGENNGPDTKCKNGEDNNGNCVPTSDKIATVLHLDDISGVNPGEAINVHGTLKTESDGTGIEGREITLEGKGIENLDIDKSVRTEGGGKFTFTTHGNAPVEGNSLKFKANFDGDDEYSNSGSNEVSYEPKGGIATSIVDLKANPGDPITIQGTLVDADGKGIDAKTLKLAGKAIENLPEDKKTASTAGDGKFTFTVPGNVPVEQNSRNLQVYFKAEGQYSKTSEAVAIPIQGGIATSIVDLKANPGDPITIQGTLVDADNKGIAGKTLKLASMQIPNLPPESTSASTDPDGKFTFTIHGNVLVPVGGRPVTFEASFAGEFPYVGTNNKVTYPSNGGIPTNIELEPISNVKPGDSLTIHGTLKTKSDDKGIDGKTVSLVGTGIESLPEASKTAGTQGGGKFTFIIPANALPDVSRDTTLLDFVRPVIDSLIFKAHFDGDNEYSKSDSIEVTYPPNGGIPTTIELNPISNVNQDGTVTVQGTLKTESDDTGIERKTITLTKRLVETAGTAGAPTDSTITLGDGSFVFADIGPLDEGVWEIQALFGGDSSYGSSSVTETYNTTAVVPTMQLQDVHLAENANEKPVETKLPIPGPGSFQPCDFKNFGPIHGDKFNEIEIRGTDLIYKATHKGESKTIEYSMLFECPGPPKPPKPPTPPTPTPPGAPVIKSPVPGTQKIQISLITGNAETGTSVEVFDGSKLLGTAPTKTDPDGNWWSLSTQLGDGTHTLTAKATNAAGKTGPLSGTVDVIVDTTGPGAPVITSPTAGTRNTAISGIDGTAEPGSKVEVFNGGTSLSTVTAGNDDKWAQTFVDWLRDGTYSFTARATDALGNTGPASPPVQVVVDTIGPAAPVITSPTAGTQNTGIPGIDGTAEPGSKVTVFNGETSLGTTTAGNDGKWAQTLGTSLSDGTYSFTAKATDALGNTGPASPPVQVVVDTIGPAAPVITSPTAGTQDHTIGGIAGTAEPGSKVTVFNGETPLGTTTAGNDGKWSKGFIDALGPGNYSFTAKATDPLGNTGPASAPVQVEVKLPVIQPPVIT